MNTVLMYVIMCLVCRFKAPEGRFRNLKFDLLYKYILTRHATSRTSNFRPAWDFVKINTLNLVPLKKRIPGFRKNSLCSLIWLEFDSFESADLPLKSSTNFRI